MKARFSSHSSFWTCSNLFLCCSAFAQFAPSTVKNPKSILTLPLQKFVFLLCNILTLGVGLWKCRSMGLLPTGTGDWLEFETRGVVRWVVDRQFCVILTRCVLPAIGDLIILDTLTVWEHTIITFIYGRRLHPLKLCRLWRVCELTKRRTCMLVCLSLHDSGFIFKLCNVLVPWIMPTCGSKLPWQNSEGFPN